MRGNDFMSASDKKKLTERQIAEQKEAKKITLYSVLFAVVMVVMIVVVVMMLVSR